MSRSFVSEAEIEEAKKTRQEEWERVRKAEDPKEAPEETYDHRSLFERLEENKRTKQEEWDSEHDIKNVVRPLDDDEAAFLDKVDDVKAGIENKRLKEEKQELDDYRKMKDKLFEESEERRLKSEVSVNKQNVSKKLVGSTKKQSKLLLGAVVKKRSASENDDSNKEPAKKAKSETGLGALAGLGDYSSSSEEENE